VTGKGKESHHKQLGRNSNRTPTVQLDYHFFTQHGDKTPDKPDLNITALTAIDLHTGMAMCVTVTKKGFDKYAMTELCKFLIETGRANATLHSDNEPAIIALCQATVKKMGTALNFRTGPAYLPQSQGLVERHHGVLQSQVKTLIAELKQNYDPHLSIDHSIFPWLVKHCNFLLEQILCAHRRANQLLSTLG
jgi:hypothetical protein